MYKLYSKIHFNPIQGSYECSCPPGFEEVCYAYLEESYTPKFLGSRKYD